MLGALHGRNFHRFYVPYPPIYILITADHCAFPYVRLFQFELKGHSYLVRENEQQQQRQQQHGGQAWHNLVESGASRTRVTRACLSRRFGVRGEDEGQQQRRKEGSHGRQGYSELLLIYLRPSERHYRKGEERCATHVVPARFWWLCCVALSCGSVAAR